MSEAGSIPGPTLRLASALTSSSRIWSAFDTCTSIRRAAVHCCPEMMVAARARRGAMALTSLSSKTTQHDLPPSSSDNRFMLSAAARMIRLPTSVEPVKLITSTSADSTSRAAASAPFSRSRLTAPAGSAGWSRQRIIAAVINDVWAAGLTMAVHPAARAGARDRTSSTAGAFHGTMIAATPAASRNIVEMVPGSGSMT